MLEKVYYYIQGRTFEQYDGTILQITEIPICKEELLHHNGNKYNNKEYVALLSCMHRLVINFIRWHSKNILITELDAQREMAIQNPSCIDIDNTYQKTRVCFEKKLLEEFGDIHMAVIYRILEFYVNVGSSPEYEIKIARRLTNGEYPALSALADEHFSRWEYLRHPHN